MQKKKEFVEGASKISGSICWMEDSDTIKRRAPQALWKPFFFYVLENKKIFG